MFGQGLMALCHIVNIKYHSAVRTDDSLSKYLEIDTSLKCTGFIEHMRGPIWFSSFI